MKQLKRIFQRSSKIINIAAYIIAFVLAYLYYKDRRIDNCIMHRIAVEIDGNVSNSAILKETLRPIGKELRIYSFYLDTSGVRIKDGDEYILKDATMLSNVYHNGILIESNDTTSIY
jgi:hypothetical protein